VAWFEYEGTCPDGTAIAGRIEAAGDDEARAMLREVMRVTLNELREVREAPRPRPMGTDEFLFLNEQIASMASAGLPLDEGLRQLARDLRRGSFRQTVVEIAADLERGVPIEEAVRRHEGRMPLLYSRVIRAGVQTGRLPALLLGLNQHLRIMSQTRRLLWETLSYPVIVLAMGLAILAFFMICVVPQFRSIFVDFGVSLPSVTLVLLYISDIFPEALAGIGISVLGLALLWHALRTTPAGRRFRESLLMCFPVLGRVYRTSLISRFIHSAATCVEAGVPLPEALRLSGDATGSGLVRADVEGIAQAAERGESVFAATQLSRIIPPIFGYAVQVALGRERLPEMLKELSRTYEDRAVHAQAAARAVLFPLMVILVGSVLLVGVLATFLPLVALFNGVTRAS